MAHAEFDAEPPGWSRWGRSPVPDAFARARVGAGA